MTRVPTRPRISSWFHPVFCSVRWASYSLVKRMLAPYVIETVGTQEYVLSKSHYLERLTEAYGSESAAEIEPHIVCHLP